MKPLVLIVLLSASGFAAAQDLPPSIQIIMDDSGVLLEPEAAQDYKLLLLAQLKALAARRSTANAQIDVISTSLGRTVWSGTPMTLRRDVARTVELIETITAKENRCNNLPGAFAELRSNITQLARESHGEIKREVYVLVFSSLVHTPRPCDETLRITLPQAPPLEGDINGALTADGIGPVISFYWVSPHQKKLWEEFLAPALEYARANGIAFNLFDVERSKRRLQSTRLSIGEAP